MDNAMRLAQGWFLGLLCAFALPTKAQTVEYIHTDALGSPVAITDVNRNVIERSEYEPFGDRLTTSAPSVTTDGPGYTGHVIDSMTELTYMQQRYYDQTLGRFLSVDPITANGQTGENFNRYRYAKNNPFGFTDPDGRQPRCFPNCGAQFVGGSIFGVDVNSAVSQGMAGVPQSWQQPDVGKVTVRPLENADKPATHSEPTANIDWFTNIDPMGNPGGGNELGGVAITTGIVGFAGLAGGAVVYEAAGAASILTGASRALGPYGNVFGRTSLGGSSILNINSNTALRVGWGWVGTRKAGTHVFRISGDLVRRLGIRDGHIDMWKISP